VNTKNKAVAYGVAGLALAGLVIFSGMALGVITTTSTEVVSILLTDPPSVPNGVSAVYLTYSDFALHASGPDAGWVPVAGQGTIETLGLVNLSETISSAKVPALNYNVISFNISSAVVTFQGKNYTATVNGGSLTVPVVGGLSVGPSHSAAAVIDIQITVLNTGNSSAPEFVVASGARAVQVPSGEVTDNMEHIGFRYGLSNHSWFQSFNEDHSDTLAVTGVKLTSSSLTFTLNNPGPNTVTIRMVVLAPAGKGSAEDDPFGSIANSSVFTVDQNGSATLFTVTPQHGGSEGEFHMELAGPGYQLAAGSSFTFTFSGAITTTTQGASVTSGATYYLILVGSGVISTQQVVAA
jgi:hypothetical protein